ncbi:MAG: reverse transcriptase family protein [Myxococcota bacterium]
MTSRLHLALADAFLAGPWTVAHLVRRAESVVGPRPRWLEALARRVVRRWPRPGGLSVDALALDLAADPRMPALPASGEWGHYEPDPRIGPLARAFLGGPWDPRALAGRGEAVLGEAGVLGTFARRLARRFPGGALSVEDLGDWLAADLPLLRVLDGVQPARIRAHWFPPVGRPPRRIPVDRPLPDLANRKALAGWLGWSASVLEGHVDARHWHRGQPRFRDYLYRWVGTRLLEVPKDRLKRAQRKILHELLDAVPVHPAAHGFVKGRSVRTHAALHAGARTVVRVDLRSFFASVQAPRVYGLFCALGFTEPVATDLTGLTTTWTPADVANHAPWNAPHLPQGAPTSPALANLVAFALDVRLAGLATRCGATYSRYADDLTFSGPSLGPSFVALVEHIVRDEGFAVHPDKTLRMGQGVRQLVTGVVVNAAPAVPRPVRDHLRAVLHRVETRGWEAVELDTPDPEAWLRGQIAWVHAVNPEHGRRLGARLTALPPRRR